jgi:acyl dehydratase
MTIAATSRRVGDVNVGDTLPELSVPITRTLIVAGAIASRDYQVVHHDPDLARQGGTPDIYMNILTTNAFVGRFVTDWAGPDGVLRAVGIRLGAPNYPGDTMTLRGEVVDKSGDVVTVDVVGANSAGNHVTGRVEVELPR